MIRIRAFLDANMFVYAADELPRMSPGTHRIRWGHIEHDVTVYDTVVDHPDQLLDNKLRPQVALLPFLAFLARRRRLELLSHAEVGIELWGRPASGDPRGLFYGAPITLIAAPAYYGRIVLTGIPEALPPVATLKPMAQAKHRQVAFIAGLKDPRLLQLRQSCGADKPNHINPNQVIDAFHLWCAESAGATHFLTAERKLLALATDSRLALACRPVLPSQLVDAVCRSLPRELLYRMLFRLDEWVHRDRWHVAA